MSSVHGGHANRDSALLGEALPNRNLALGARQTSHSAVRRGAGGVNLLRTGQIGRHPFGQRVSDGVNDVTVDEQ
jgi:hypothetical protein